MYKFKKGDKVIMGECSPSIPQGKGTCLPEAGTIGTIVTHVDDDLSVVFVQWPKGTTKDDDRHRVNPLRLSLHPDTPPQKEYTLAEARDIVIRYFKKLSNGGNEHGECRGINCNECIFSAMESKVAQCIVSALTPDYLFRAEKFLEEPQVDWSKVAVDTPILVKWDKSDDWTKRHYACLDRESGEVRAYDDGLTSWTGGRTSHWRFAKLTTEEEVK